MNLTTEYGYQQYFTDMSRESVSRWRVKKIAEMYGVTGLVRNDWNCSMTMEAQGTEEQIDQVTAVIRRGMCKRIDNIFFRKFK